MIITVYIWRIILAMLLASPATTRDVSASQKVAEVHCKAFVASAHPLNEACKTNDLPTADAVLSVSWSHPGVVHVGTGGAGSCTAFFPAISFHLLRAPGKAVRTGHWRTVAAAINADQLRAHYPAHGFW